MENTDLSQICKLFAQDTFLYLYEIDGNHRNILFPIGHKVDQKVRVRRGFEKSIAP